MRFELEQNNRGVSEEDLLADIRRSAKDLGADSITVAQYEKVGRFHPRTIQKRMGSWTKALQLAGLQLARHVGITDEDLLENIKALWTSLGRRPRYGEVKGPESRYSAKPYETRFGSWSESLKRFVEWVNSDDPAPSSSEGDLHPASGAATSSSPSEPPRRRTRREPSDRQRFRILMRDGFRCRSCGASPIVQPGVELHVDHVLPWSKGGETADGNLETKCQKCNLGKGAAFHA